MVDEQQLADRKLSRELKNDYRSKSKVIKLLLLGTGKALYIITTPAPSGYNNISFHV